MNIFLISGVILFVLIYHGQAKENYFNLYLK